MLALATLLALESATGCWSAALKNPAGLLVRLLFGEMTRPGSRAELIGPGGHRDMSRDG